MLHSKIYLKVKAIIFDMDGVITNTMPDHYRVWQTIFKSEGSRVSHLDVYSREGQKGIDSVKEIFTARNKDFSIKKARIILKRKESLFKKIVKRRFIPGTRRFLRRLHAQGFQLALVTGTSRHELHRILPENLFKLFQITVTGSDIRNGKPHPAPFLKALKLMKLKSPEVVVIENAPFGIRSAKAAGLRCLAVETSLPRNYLKGSDFVFSSIRELENKVIFALPKPITPKVVNHKNF